jgi:signal transduction histidine kinase
LRLQEDEEKSESSLDESQTFSISHLLDKDEDFLKHKVFTTGIKKKNETDEHPKYMYIQITIRRTKKRKLMVQIKDMSAQILNKKIQAEKLLLTLINATVSHELRGPLASMISQIYALESFFKIFAGVILTLE